MQQGLKDVGANVRAGISGFGGGVVEGVKGGVSALTHTAVVSKPREFASLIRNKFGSADNIAHLKDTLEDGVGGHSEDTPTPRALSGSATLVSSPKYGSDDECSSATSGSAVGSNSGGAGTGGGMLGPVMGSPRLDGHHHHHHIHGSWDSLLEGLQEIKASQTHMEDAIEDMKGQLRSDYSYMTQCLQEERYRYRPPPHQNTHTISVTHNLCPEFFGKLFYLLRNVLGQQEVSYFGSMVVASSPTVSYQSPAFMGFYSLLCELYVHTDG